MSRKRFGSSEERASCSRSTTCQGSRPSTASLTSKACGEPGSRILTATSLLWPSEPDSIALTRERSGWLRRRTGACPTSSLEHHPSCQRLAAKDGRDRAEAGDASVRRVRADLPSDVTLACHSVRESP